MSSPNPSTELTPAAVTVAFLEDGEGDVTRAHGGSDGIAVDFAIAVLVTVDLIVTGAAVLVIVD